jgi:hypothetical protein
MGELGFDIGFSASGFGETKDALEALCREITGMLDDCDFARAFYETELVEQGSEPTIIVERVAALDVTDEAVVARFCFGGGAFVFVSVDVEILRLDREAPEQAIKFLRPFYLGDAGVLRRFALAEFVSLPECVLLVWLAEKKYLAHFLIVCIREKNEQRLLLFDAGEVK